LLGVRFGFAARAQRRRRVAKLAQRVSAGLVVLECRAPEARHIVSHLFSERNAYRFQHKRAAEDHPNADEGTLMGLHRRHLPASEHLRPRHRREGEHIHLLLQFPPTLMIADAIRDIKANSSGWMSGEIGSFAWQQGYGGFGVSKSNIAAVVQYIQNQEKHHKKMTFEEEFIALLKKHGIEYDPRMFSDDVPRLWSCATLLCNRGSVPRLRRSIPSLSVNPALTRWANFATRLRRWGGLVESIPPLRKRRTRVTVSVKSSCLNNYLIF
jgi:transposase IS200 family protein